MKNSLLYELLRSLESTAFALLDDEGILLDASAGFLNLLPQNEAGWISQHVNRFFINPGFDTLKNSINTKHNRLFTIGASAGITSTVCGSFYLDSKKWFFLAEPMQAQHNFVASQFSKLIMEQTETARRLSRTNIALKKSEKHAVEQSLIDPLTKLGNRRCYERDINAEIARARRGHRQLGLIMCDLDDFKHINDEFGHEVGDIVLKVFSDVILKSLRKFDIASRFGGEEFVILVPGVKIADVLTIAERIRSTLEKKDFSPYPIKMTASFGVSTLSRADSPDSLLERADKAMYAAKEAGKNRINIAE